MMTIATADDRTTCWCIYCGAGVPASTFDSQGEPICDDCFDAACDVGEPDADTE